MQVTFPHSHTMLQALGLTLVAVPCLILSAALIALLFLDGKPFDYWLWEQAAGRVWDGTLYVWGTPSPYGEAQPYEFRYAPLFAITMQPIALFGMGLWRLLHIASLALLPWRLALVVLAFPPFWLDVQHGNVMTFVAVLGYLAMRGSGWATAGYFTVLLFVPRPLMLPLAAWIVWQRPSWRLPALGFALIGTAQLAYPGFAEALLRSAGAASVYGIIWPPPWIPWLPIGLVLGTFLAWKGRLGAAALGVSPYILPYYLIVLLWELVPAERQPAKFGNRTATSRTSIRSLMGLSGSSTAAVDRGQ